MDDEGAAEFCRCAPASDGGIALSATRLRAMARIMNARRCERTSTRSGENSGLLQRAGDLLGRDIAQAVIMSEAAGSLQAGAAFEPAVDDPAVLPHRTRARGIGRAENRHGRHPERTSQMHTSGVVARKAVTQREQPDQFAYRCLSGGDERTAAAPRSDLLALRTIIDPAH